MKPRRLYSLFTAVPRVSWAWQSDLSIGNEEHPGGLVGLKKKRFPRRFFHLEIEGAWRQLAKIRKKSLGPTKVPRSVDRMITLPNPAHPRNSSGQRAHPSWFYLAACSMELEIQQSVPWFTAERHAKRAVCLS